MIRVQEVSKRYGTVQALNGVSFEAANGQITGLLGPNGAGKTTALRVLATLVEPDSGSASVDGMDVRQHPDWVRARLGVLPDDRGLYPRLTAREHLEYYGQLHGCGRSEVRARLEPLAALLDMGELLDRRTAGFSQGERTKVAIGRALVHGPSNVVLDEPTNGLDVVSTRALRMAIRRLADAGAAVLLSSHIMQEISALCDRIVVLARGEVRAAGSPDRLRLLTGRENLEDAFVQLIGSKDGLEG